MTAQRSPTGVRARQLRLAWVLLGLTVLFVFAVRMRLRDLPLERDEGEYAYAGQLILQGVPPYLEATNLKLPGTYGAYAVIMAVFGQTCAGIHLGVALVNAASILLIFLIGMKLMDEVAAAGAALSFGLLSLSPGVLGLAGHATHFVTLFALGGLLALVHATGRAQNDPTTSPPTRPKPDGESFLNRKWEPERGSPDFPPSIPLVALSGILFGLAFLMKQHGLCFGLFGGLYLVWLIFQARFSGRLASHQGVGLRPTHEETRAVLGTLSGAGMVTRLGRMLAVFGVSFSLPYIIASLLLWRAGVFHQFVFWTIRYASQYASETPVADVPYMLGLVLLVVVGPNLALWLLPLVGAIVMWRPGVISPNGRVLLLLLALCSVAAVSLGFYFRAHYFIMLLPAVSLLSGAAVSHAIQLLRRRQFPGFLLALPAVGLAGAGLVAAGIGHGELWFRLSAGDAAWSIYGESLFAEAINAARFLRENSTPESRTAVIGSEPEIYFYAHRRSVTSHIYTYPLMEPQPFALRMQEEMIDEIEAGRPQYVVYVENDLSWLVRSDSNRKIFDWWKGYRDANLELVKTIEVTEGPFSAARDLPPAPPANPNRLLIYKQKASDLRAAGKALPGRTGQGPGEY